MIFWIYVVMITIISLVLAVYAFFVRKHIKRGTRANADMMFILCTPILVTICAITLLSVEPADSENAIKEQKSLETLFGVFRHGHP